MRRCTIVGVVAIEPDIHEIGVGSYRVRDGEQLYIWVGRSVHIAVDKITIVNK
jgi:hypothetical protein